LTDNPEVIGFIRRIDTDALAAVRTNNVLSIGRKLASGMLASVLEFYLEKPKWEQHHFFFGIPLTSLELYKITNI